MVAVGLVLAMSLAAAAAESVTAEEPAAVVEAESAVAVPVNPAADAEPSEPDDEGAAPAEDTEPAEVSAPQAPKGELERRIKDSRRKRAEDAIVSKSDEANYGDPGVLPGDDTFVGSERPAVLRPRWPGGALALGAFVGFGAGYYYAGVPRWGFVFTLVDAALVGGFVASTIMLNNLVIEHDFNQGKSLARDERDFTKREQRWYTASVIFALAGVGARAFQAFGGLRAARRTNATLQSFSFVPLGDGGALELELSW